MHCYQSEVYCTRALNELTKKVSGRPGVQGDGRLSVLLANLIFLGRGLNCSRSTRTTTTYMSQPQILVGSLRPWSKP